LVSGSCSITSRNFIRKRVTLFRLPSNLALSILQRLGCDQSRCNRPLVELPNRPHTRTTTERRIQFSFHDIAHTKTGLVRSDDMMSAAMLA
jgi:hypothetical protein